MLGLLRMVAWTMTAIAMLLLFTTHIVHSQDTSADTAREQEAERAAADRYEQILSNRPQLGLAFDKLYEFYARQSTLEELCERLEKTSKSGEDGNAYQLLGLLQLRRGLGSESVDSLTRAESLLPNEALTSLYRSRALSFTRQYAEALAALYNAVDRKPNQAVAIDILKEFRQFKDRGVDTQISIESISKLEQQFANNPQVNELLADCYIELGSPDAALPVYEKLIALTRDPLRRIEVRVQLARLKKQLGDPKQSLVELEQLATQVKPQSWLHTSLLEQIEQLTEELNGIDGLVAYYERSLSKQPDDIASMLRLAKIFGNQSKFDDAEHWVAKAIERSPTQPEPRLAMIELMEETNRFERASEAMQQLVELDPSNVDHIVRWGHLVARSSAIHPASSIGDVQKSNAAAIWKRLLIGNENDPAKAVQVAELMRGIAMTDEALKLYQQAVQVSGEMVEFSELLADYLIQLDRREEARQVLISCMASARDDRESLVQLSSLFTRFKFPVDALDSLEKACEKQADVNELIQLAELQVANKRQTAALDTLRRATETAESSADLMKVWDLHIKTLNQISQLSELIATSQKTIQQVQGHAAEHFEALQQLAIMQSASGQAAEAAATALQATVIKPDSMRAWLLAAKLQHEAGLSIREIETLDKLCKLDTKHATDYLQRIATIYFQLSQVEQALATMERIFALPSATLQHFQTAASFRLQAKKPEQAVEILRRATQVFPRDRSAWLVLAKQLTELHNGPSALDAAWHVLEFSNNETEQREAISLLAKLHGPDVTRLLESLTKFGVEHERDSESELWSAWAMLESPGKHSVDRIISKLVGGIDASPESLRAAIELALMQNDFSHAAAIQRRLYRTETNVANQLRLGELLWLAGDLSAAGHEWQSIMRNPSNLNEVTAFAQKMMDSANWRMAVSFIDSGVQSEMKAWNLIAMGIFANIQDKNLSKAAELSEQLLAIELPFGTMIKAATSIALDQQVVPLTATDRLTWLEHAGAWQAALNVVDANRSGYRTNQSNPRASQAAAVRYLAIQRGADVRSNQTARFNVQCFAEARALAVLAKFGKVNQRRDGVSNEFAKYIADAIESKNRDRLWDCVLVLEPASYRNLSFTPADENPGGSDLKMYVDVLNALVAMNEPAAIELAINEIVARRQLQHQLADRLSQPVRALDDEELARLERLVQKVDSADATTTFTGQIALAIELLRAHKVAEGQRLLSKTLADTTDISRLVTCARQYLSNDSKTQQLVSEVLLRAFELELKSNGESNDLAFAISAFRANANGSKSQTLLFGMLRLQAKHLEGLSADQVFSDSRSNETRKAYRIYRKLAVALPDRSSVLSNSLRAAIIDTPRSELPNFVEDISSNKTLTPEDLTVSFFAAGFAQAILDDSNSAVESLKQAKEQKIATDVLSLYEVWLLVTNQKLEDARKLVDHIEPSNESILRECELWKMDLAVKLGNTAEAQRAALALSKLPLSVHENAEVAAVLK